MQGLKYSARQIITRCGKGFDGAVGVLAFVAGLAILGQAGAVTYDVIVRYILNRPTVWAFYWSAYALVLVTFFGAAWAQIRGGHIHVDLVLSQLPARSGGLLKGIGLLFGAVFFALFTWKGVEVTWDSLQRGLVMAHVIPVPKFPLLFLIPLGSLFFTIQLFKDGIRSIRDALKQTRIRKGEK